MSKKKHRKKRGEAATNPFGGKKVKKEESREENKNREPIIEEVEEGATTETPNRQELFKELGILNLSIDLVTLIVFATLLNLYYVNSLKAETLDELFNTNLKDNFVDTTKFPRITNTIFLITTGLFLIINYNTLQENKCEHKNDCNNKDVVSSYKAFLATLFAFLAVTISRDNLEV